MRIGNEVALQPARETVPVAIRIGRVMRVIVAARLNARGLWRIGACIMKVREAHEQGVRHQAKQRKRFRSRPFAAYHCDSISHFQT